MIFTSFGESESTPVGISLPGLPVRFEDIDVLLIDDVVVRLQDADARQVLFQRGDRFLVATDAVIHKLDALNAFLDGHLRNVAGRVALGDDQVSTTLRPLSATYIRVPSRLQQRPLGRSTSSRHSNRR